MRYKKLSSEMKDQMKTAVLLLRFRTTTPTQKSFKFKSYQCISRIVNLTCRTVQYICTQATQDAKKPSKPKDPNRKLD